MKRVGLGRFSAGCSVACPPHAATRTDPGALVGAKRHVLLELQWQGRDGEFHHIALDPRGVRRVLGTSATVALFVFAVAGAVIVTSNRTLAPSGVAEVLREHADLKARENLLREQAFGLAEQLYERVEQGGSTLGTADTPVQAWVGQCPSVPARDAETEVLLDWLSEQSARLEALGDELAAGRVEMGGKRASVPATGGGRTAAPPSAAVLRVADMGSARPQ